MLPGSCRQVLGRRRQCVDDRWTWTRPPGTTWRRSRRRLGWVLGEPPEPHVGRHTLFSSCANMPSSVVIMQHGNILQQHHLLHIKKSKLRQRGSKSTPGSRESMYCDKRAFWQESTWIICNARTLQTMLQFCIHKAAEMFELKHGGPRRFRRTRLWPTASHLSILLPIHARFQAPGEQVEIVKSASQPHLNGLQGYVDFSCLTWDVFFFPSLISCHLIHVLFCWWHPSLLR